MHQPLPYALFILLSFLLLVVTAHLLHTKLQIPVDSSRKFLHISGGMLALCMPLILPTHWWVLALCLLAFFLLLFTYLLNYLQGIHGTKRKSIGSIIFPIPVYVCFLCSEIWNSNLLFYLPICLLTLADPIAEWGGKKWGHLTISFFNHQKTLAGTICFAIAAFVLSLFISIAYTRLPIEILMTSIAVPVVSGLSELISLRGWDNITVPLSSLLILLLMFF